MARYIRREIRDFLGAGEDWRGLYPTKARNHLRPFQVGVKWKTLLGRPGGIAILSSINLLDVVNEEEKTELLGLCDEDIKSKTVHWMSSSTTASGKLQVMVKGVDVKLEGQKTKAVDLLARVQEKNDITVFKWKEVDAIVGRYNEELVQAIDAVSDGKTPSAIYIVVGVEYVDLKATARTALEAELSVGVEEIAAGGVRGSKGTVDASIAKDAAALILMMKYEGKSKEK